MKKQIAVALVVASLAVPSFAAVTRDSDRRGADRTAITRLLNFVKRLVGIGANDDLITPRP